jgi:hypothetical protein
MVTTLEPTSSGIAADQLFVPLAVPELPVLVDHVTFVTPTLSLAVPLKAMVVADVETEVPPGDPTVKVGGVVSDPLEELVCLVTVTTCDT